MYNAAILNTSGEYLLYDKRQDDNGTYQWLFKDKAELFRDIKCIKVCLQCFSAVCLRMLYSVLHCSCLALRRKLPGESDTQISVGKLAVSFLSLPLSHPFLLHSQPQRTNHISCTVMSGVHREKQKLPVLYCLDNNLTFLWWLKTETENNTS